MQVKDNLSMTCQLQIIYMIIKLIYKIIKLHMILATCLSPMSSVNI